MQFRLDPFPIFRFSVDGVELEQKLFMAHGQNTAIIKYQLNNVPSAAYVQLELRPLIAFRDYHSLTHENGAINGRVDTQRELVRVSPYVGFPLLCSMSFERIKRSGALKGIGFLLFFLFASACCTCKPTLHRDCVNQACLLELKLTSREHREIRNAADVVLGGKPRVTFRVHLHHDCAPGHISCGLCHVRRCHPAWSAPGSPEVC
jgi:hypothetical protein